MEKTADDQFQVFLDNGKTMLRTPGGMVIPYDNRFGNIKKEDLPKVFPNDS